MAKRDPENKTRMVIIGGGAAGATAAETLRQSNFTGEITVLTNESLLPYDRTLLSKCLADGDGSKMGLREREFFETHEINYRLNTQV